jgi:hypothetical protein
VESGVALLRGSVDNSATFEQLGDHVNMAVFGSEV